MASARAKREAEVDVIMQAYDGRLAQPESISGSCGFLPGLCPGEKCESARSENFGAEPFIAQPPKSLEGVSSLGCRVSKRTLGLVITGVIGLTLLAKMPQISRLEGVINARVITLQAPISGEVGAGPMQLDFGTSIARGDLLLRVANRGADHSRVDDLTRQIEQLAEQRPDIANRLGNARALLKDLTEQTQLFVEARIIQLEARQDELRAEVAVAQARNRQAKTSLDRFTRLASGGWVSRAQLDLAERDGSIAEKMEAAAQKRLEVAGIELGAARRGIFVGSSNNDRPRYMQRSDQLEQQVSNLAQTLKEHDQRVVRLNRDLAKEKARYDSLSAAEIIAPAEGSVWEILTTPEEQVRVGQDLVRLLDCGQMVVTAIVNEGVYNRLRVGSSARFQPGGGGKDLPGAVVRLRDAFPANLAIQPSAHVQGSYHVMVAVPKLAEGRGCMVGLTGRVSFNDSWPEAIAATAQIGP
jgi:multidrug resistance efflux pump